LGKLPTALTRYQAEIDAELRSVLVDRSSLLYDMIRYHFGWIDEKGNPQKGWAGKAVRPTLCLLACEAVGGDWHDALPAAAAIELVHNYSLVHDDIQDDDRERRHRPTVWSIWGKPQGINAGSAMRMLANVAIRRLVIPHTKQVHIQSLLDEATIHLIEGQYFDINYEKRLDITSKEYLQMVGGKTAALIACALEVGAEIGTGDRQAIDGLRQFGWNLGITFQTRDDYLGIWGRPENTGKSLWGDIKRRKKTLPVVYGMENASGDMKQNLIRFYSDGVLAEETAASVVGILEAVGAREHTAIMTGHYASEAKGILTNLPISRSAMQDFNQILHFIVERDF
jgi:geranylgeranyl diphosphate synthase type I